jgi:hypothetical protein
MLVGRFDAPRRSARELLAVVTASAVVDAAYRHLEAPAWGCSACETAPGLHRLKLVNLNPHIQCFRLAMFDTIFEID